MGGGGSTGVLYGTGYYTRGAYDSPIILSTADGSQQGSFASNTAPAFNGTTMYTLQNGNLVAVDPSGSPNRWTFRVGNLVTAPVVSGGTVFVGAADGAVYGVSARSGKQVWTGSAGSAILGPDEQNADVLVVGIFESIGLRGIGECGKREAFNGAHQPIRIAISGVETNPVRQICRALESIALAGWSR